MCMKELHFRTRTHLVRRCQWGETGKRVCCCGMKLKRKRFIPSLYTETAKAEPSRVARLHSGRLCCWSRSQTRSCISRSSLNSEAQAAIARVDSIESIKMISALLENPVPNSRDDNIMKQICPWSWTQEPLTTQPRKHRLQVSKTKERTWRLWLRLCGRASGSLYENPKIRFKIHLYFWIFLFKHIFL